MRKLYGMVLLFCVIQVIAAPQLSCIKWGQDDPTIFQPTPNANNQISPDYGLYWIKNDPATGGEDFKRAYTPSNYLPYYSDGTKNNTPDPKTDNGAARAKYNATQLKGYYDPNKPTIIFFHGWQPGMTQERRRVDLCYRYPTGKSSYSPLYNTLQYWKGWNVAIFYWNQFADEKDFADAEAKLYSSSIHQHMRWAYMKPGDSAVHHCTDGASNCIMPRDASGHVKTVGDLAYEAVVAALPSVTTKHEFRIVGQSFGAQLATIVADKLVTQNANTLKPTRLTLLDPYFSTGRLDYVFAGKTVAQHIDDLVADIEAHTIPVAEYRTSNISCFPTGDENHWLMSHTAFERLFPKYLSGVSGLQLLEAQHISSIYLYFQSYRAAPFWDKSSAKAWNKSYVNAQATNDQIQQMMSSQRFQSVSPLHKSEYDFPDTQDDVFVATDK